MTATVNGPWDSGTKTLNYGKNTVFPFYDIWSFYPTTPSSLGQHETYVILDCLNGETRVLIGALIAVDVSPPGIPSGILDWVFYDLCHGLLNSTFDEGFSTCPGTRLPNLIETSNQAAPYNISFDVVNNSTNRFATAYYSDLSIDGPDPSTVDPHECCDFCPIPKKDLTLTYTINSLCGSGSGSFSVPLVYDSSLNKWEAATFSYQCVDRRLPSFDFTFTFSCETGLVLRRQSSNGGDFTCAFYVYTANCDPFHVVYFPYDFYSGKPPCPVSYLVFTTVIIDE